MSLLNLLNLITAVESGPIMAGMAIGFIIVIIIALISFINGYYTIGCIFVLVLILDLWAINNMLPGKLI